MNRKSRHTGVHQRCGPNCPPAESGNRCYDHDWSFYVELPKRGGKRTQVSKGGFPNPREAARARAEVVRQHERGTLADDQKITFGDWVRRWIAQRDAAGELRPSTKRSYEDLANHHLLPRVGHLRLSELRAHHLTTAYREAVADRRAEVEQYRTDRPGWLRKRLGKGETVQGSKKKLQPPRPLGPATVQRIHAVASGALNAARKGGLIQTNPAVDAELPKAVRHKVFPWTPETYRAFLAATAGDRLHVAWWLLGHTGLRRGEVCGLQWSDVDLETGALVVRRTRTAVGYQVHEGDAKSAAGQDRVVYLDGGTVELLRRHRKSQLTERMKAGAAYTGGGWLLSDELGAPIHPERLSKVFASAVKHCGLPPMKLHGLRHFYASALISDGMDVAKVSKLVGHSSVQTTADVYGNLFQAAGKDAGERVARIVAGEG